MRPFAGTCVKFTDRIDTANDPVNRTDPTGEFGIIGFVIGAGAEILGQVASGDWKNASAGQILKNLGKAAISGGVGAVTGGVASLVKNAGTAAKVYTVASTGLKAGLVGSLAKQGIDGEGIDAGEVLKDGLTEGASAGVGVITEPVGLVAEMQGEAIVQTISNAAEIAREVLVAEEPVEEKR